MEVKKKIMFIHDEDYNYFTYSILIILNTLGCHNDKHIFVDYRKLAIIINLIKNDNILDSFRMTIENQQANIFEKYSMMDYYPKVKQDIIHIRKLIFSLNRKGILILKADKRFNTVSLYMYKSEEVINLVNDERFIDEINRIKSIRTLIPRIRSLKYNTLLCKVYGQNEVTKWDI